MTKCNSCGREPFEYVTRCVRCGVAQPLEDSGKQLKAEILPLLNDALDEFSDRKFDRGEYYLKQAMAKLSAV